jgi:hypothetical protein
VRLKPQGKQNGQRGNEEANPATNHPIGIGARYQILVTHNLDQAALLTALL